jgi:isopentenyl diphosphate isomerase/L-lactate dehydrogenase-like FMN-dependent dehydrogenase
MSDQNQGDFQALHEFVKKARVNLNRNVWDYLVGAAETETTMKRNRLALDSLAFRPRVLVDVSEIDCSWQFFGNRIRLPVALAPVGWLQHFTPDGAVAAVAGAAGFGIPAFVSWSTQPSMEQAARAGDTPKVYQLYVRGDDARSIDEHAQRAIDAGYVGFCFTADSPLTSRRERDIALRYRNSWNTVAAPYQRYQAALNWSHIERFKAKYNIPLIVKGIVLAEDAERAVELGVDVVYVSNHGGRQLDHGRGTIDVLPEIVAAVAGRAKVFVDSGFSRGTDIIKAIALGADLVLIGRLYCYALAAAGAAGVTRMLEILENEIHQSLGMLGVTDFTQVGRSHVQAAPPVDPPGVLSAFPLLNLDNPY